jgi:hypothetical protein
LNAKFAEMLFQLGKVQVIVIIIILKRSGLSSYTVMTATAAAHLHLLVIWINFP